jgi:hypothetical protein
MPKMRPNAMKRRAAPVIAALALAITMLTATPALATYRASAILFPSGATTFYSPFSGPATIRMSFDSVGPTYDPPATITVRLRVQGSTSTIHSQNFNIDPNPDTSPKDLSFSWPALSVSTTTRYEVVVSKGSTQLRVRAFTLKPHLVKITSITPDPFFPWINDGYKDTTNISWNLAANSNPVDLEIFAADAGGGCCGALVRSVHYPNRVLGNYHFIWGGRDNSNALLPIGDYWVRITATDYGGQTRSTIAKVALERFYRVSRTSVKNGIAFDHTGSRVVHVSGGTCGVKKDTATRDLWIRCRNASFRVYWHWNLPASANITQVGFTLIGVPGYTCGATKGHTGNDTFLQVGGVGTHRCRVDKARVRYTYLKAS